MRRHRSIHPIYAIRAVHASSGSARIAFAALVALAACDKTSSSATPAPAPAASVAPAIPADCAGGTKTSDVTFSASDGLVVHATSSNPCGGAPRPVVVLAHQMCSSRVEWSQPAHDWVGALGKRGVATLSIDLRGHGDSKAFPGGTTHDLCAETSNAASAALYLGMVNDVKAAIAYARGALAAKSVSLVGASIGANASIVAFADDPTVAAVVALSPGLDYRGIKTEAPTTAFGARPAFFDAAQDDTESAAAVARLKKDNPVVVTQVFTTGGHGNKMIDAHPDELSRLVGVIDQQVSDSAAAKP